MRNFFIVLLFFAASCTSKKYTAAFNNHYESYNSAKATRANTASLDTSLVASIKGGPDLELFDKIKKKGTSVIAENSIKKLRKELLTFSSLETSVVKPKSDSVNVGLSIEEDTRKVEPKGLLGLLLILAAIPMAYLVPTLPFLMFITGGILGISSVKTVKREKGKWKGAGFGKAAKILFIVGGIFMILLIALVMSLVSSGRLS